jgi:hypothetical protein
VDQTSARDRLARLATRLCTRHGTTCDYIPASGSSITGLKCAWMNRSEQLLDGDTGATDEELCRLWIPRQTGFPPTNFLPGATIKTPATSGIVYEIVRKIPDAMPDTMATGWTFDLRRRPAKP